MGGCCSARRAAGELPQDAPGGRGARRVRGGERDRACVQHWCLQRTALTPHAHAKPSPPCACVYVCVYLRWFCCCRSASASALRSTCRRLHAF